MTLCEDLARRHIEQAIDRAEKGQPDLPPSLIEVAGMTNGKVKRLLNNLCGLPSVSYLEVGVHRGATFTAANYGNPLRSSIAIDNWSEFSDDATRQCFLDNCKNFLSHPFRFIEQDCFTIRPEQCPEPVNVYFYDGNHSRESHVRALTHFLPMMDDMFIFLVDDYCWTDPPLGTKEAIRQCGVTVLYERELLDDWWNGLYVGLFRK